MILIDVVQWALFSLSHVFAGSLGGGIIALSFVVRGALLPWSLRAARRTLAMRAAMEKLQPRLKELERRYASDPAKLRTALLVEYRRSGVAPMDGTRAGLMAIQIPIGWAVYTVIRKGISAGGAFLWISSLARPDAVVAVAVGLLTVAAGATAPAAGAHGSHVLVASAMGLVSAAIVFHMSAGVGLYWASTSCVGIVQNALLRRGSQPATR
ncbi:MAG TPA: membrane protein insertase YidC [Longimicrobiales bacterium]